MQEGRGLGGKRVCKMSVNLTNEQNNKLGRLAIACGMPKAKLAALILDQTLDDSMAVLKLQQEFNRHEAYKVLPISVDGETKYMFRG